MLISQKSNFKAFSIINTFIKNKIIGTKNKLKIKALELIKYLVGLFYFGVAFTTLASILVWFTFLINFIWSIGDFYIPKNLENLKVINRILKYEYKLQPEDFKISYFNDDYIFIEFNYLQKSEIDKLISEKKTVPKKVIILKTEVLFNTE
jgi:hypothetical protein